MPPVYLEIWYIIVFINPNLSKEIEPNNNKSNIDADICRKTLLYINPFTFAKILYLNSKKRKDNKINWR